MGDGTEIGVDSRFARLLVGEDGEVDLLAFGLVAHGAIMSQGTRLKSQQRPTPKTPRPKLGVEVVELGIVVEPCALYDLDSARMRLAASSGITLPPNTCVCS